MGGYEQYQWVCGFLAIKCFMFSVPMRIIVIVGSQSVFEKSDNNYIAVSQELK